MALLFSGAEPFVHFWVEGIKRNNSKIILNLDQWFRRCCLKDFLSGALAALLFCGTNHLCNFEIDIMGNIHEKLYEI